MTRSNNILGKRLRTIWTAQQVEQLAARYPHEKTEYLACDMGMTAKQLYHKANALGLKKSATYLASPAACRLRRGDNIGIEHRFHAGQTVWNKGMHFNAGGRSAETRFKTGSVPPNRLPVGHVRINSDGYQDIKTAPGPRNWVALHRWNWKQEHGQFPPKGMALIFNDGDRMNCAIGNLDCISRRELMQRNSVHTLPAELATLIQLNGALTRKLNGKRSST